MFITIGHYVMMQDTVMIKKQRSRSALNKHKERSLPYTPPEPRSCPATEPVFTQARTHTSHTKQHQDNFANGSIRGNPSFY
mmetsp:Transcript_6236/g.17584  ORF Transcript_6236/g.17584 Transcript_6236/m.17584 type:complete len:81 (-) Transcript_6236:129-371(-)